MTTPAGGDVEARAKYLRKVSDSERYTDFSSDPAALPIIQGLERDGFCRVVWDGPAWRVYQSSEQTAKAVAYLAKLTSTKPEPSRIAERAKKTKVQLSKGPGLQTTHEMVDSFIDDALSHITAIEAENAAIKSAIVSTMDKAADDIQDWRRKFTAAWNDLTRMRDALEEIANTGLQGAPDIHMRRIARAALSHSKPGEG